MNICVYCSANDHIDGKYKTEAYRLGQWIGRQGHTLVYGGATGGLMTSVSEGAAHEGAEIVGVVPERIVRSGRESQVVTQQVRVGMMSERKQRMRDLADLFVVLPGSFGSMDEMFDVLASGTVGEHRKPLILYNMGGFYDSLLQQIERMRQERFIPQQESYTFQVGRSLEEVFLFINQIKSRHENRIP